MKINKLGYIDFEEVNKLLEGFNKTTGFVTAILDLEGNVLSKSGWRQICTEFHRVNPETSANCSISDTLLANKTGKNGEYHFYKCLNGLVDVAVPIVINGEHIANLFSGQFFFEEPDHQYFKSQARKHGFDEQEYLKALEKVPVVSREKVQVAMDFLLSMTHLISEITFQRLEQVELNAELIKSEERTRSVLDHILEGCQIIGFDWKYIYLNHTAEIHNRRPNTELIGRRYMDIWPGVEKTEVFKIIKQVLENRVSNHFENEFIFPDGYRGWFDLSIQPVPEGVFILSIDITERKKVEKALQENEEKYRLIADNSDDWIYWFAPDGHLKYVSPACERVTGFTVDEFTNNPGLIQEIVFEADKEKVSLHAKFSKHDDLPHELEFRITTKDGELRWISHKCSPISGINGELLGRRGTNRNITRQKNAEEVIALLNERISTATRVSQVGIWDWDIRNNVLAWDDQMYALYGLKKEDFTGTLETWINGLHPDDREFCQIETRLALLGEKEYDSEYRIVWPDGTILYSKARGEVFRNEIGEPVRMVGINYDITAQKLAEEKVRKKDQEFRKLSANVPDLIYQFTRNPDGSYCVPIASEGIRNIFGCTPEEVINDFSPISRVIYPDDMKRVVSEIEYSADHLTHFTCEFRVQIPGREVQWIYSNSTPEKLPDGSVTWYGFNVDITHKKLAEEALRESEKKFRKLNETLEERVKKRTSQLLEANNELEAFSYSVSHDLRSPLRHINGFAEILTNKYSDQLPEEARKYLNTIAVSAKKMGILIDDLLSFSRTGRAELKQSTIKMNQIIEDALLQIKPSLEDRTIEWQISPLPEVNADYNLMRLVWINLLDNAIKYTSTREKAVIQIGYNDEKRERVFFIKDNGAGFDMKYAHKLFGVFQRLHSSSQFDGTGIGLANVRRIILRHNGRTWAESEIDKGAAFYFSIPK